MGGLRLASLLLLFIHTVFTLTRGLASFVV
jgi:hypothetical protein